MPKTNDGGPAFPRVQTGAVVATDTGMSLRDWFAGQALAAVIASDPDGQVPASKQAEAAYFYADAMLKDRG